MATPQTGDVAVVGSVPVQNVGVQTRAALADDPYSVAGDEVYALGKQVINSWPATITHNLHNVNALLTAAYGAHVSGWYVKVTVLSQTSDTMVISGDVPPPAGGGTLHWRVQDT